MSVTFKHYWHHGTTDTRMGTDGETVWAEVGNGVQVSVNIGNGRVSVLATDVTEATWARVLPLFGGGIFFALPPRNPLTHQKLLFGRNPAEPPEQHYRRLRQLLLDTRDAPHPVVLAPVDREGEDAAELPGAEKLLPEVVQADMPELLATLAVRHLGDAQLPRRDLVLWYGVDLELDVGGDGGLGGPERLEVAVFLDAGWGSEGRPAHTTVLDQPENASHFVGVPPLSVFVHAEQYTAVVSSMRTTARIASPGTSRAA